MALRSYDGSALDVSYQYIGEVPYWQGEGETVYATDPEDPGEERTENVPVPEKPERPDVDGQSTIEDWSRW